MSSSPIRILLVEDEFMIAEFIASLITSNGMVVAGRAGTVAAALEAIETTSFDCALLDVNLNKESIAPVADRLAALPKRYAFLTGYGRHKLPAGHGHIACIGKPVKIHELLAVLADKPIVEPDSSSNDTSTGP
jgi:DNA-binding response OmpR family regulator